MKKVKRIERLAKMILPNLPAKIYKDKAEWRLNIYRRKDGRTSVAKYVTQGRAIVKTEGDDNCEAAEKLLAELRKMGINEREREE